MRMRPDAALSLRRDLRTAYLSRLRRKRRRTFAAVPDAAEGLHFRLYEAARRGSSPEEIADLAKSKRYAHARLRRMVMCAALGVRAGDANGIPPYIRVLAFDARRALLREMKTSAALPVVVKVHESKTKMRASNACSTSGAVHTTSMFLAGKTAHCRPRTAITAPRPSVP